MEDDVWVSSESGSVNNTRRQYNERENNVWDVLSPMPFFT